VARVLFVRPVPTKKRIQLDILDGSEKATYTVRESTYLELGSPTAGTDLTESMLGTVRFEDECLRAIKRAMGYLSLSDKSRYELRMKLIRAGISYEAADVALERISELGYLDEDRQLERAVEREANYKLRGRYYIKRKLSAKGYSISAITRAIERLTDSGEVDFNANFELLAEKKGAFSDEERQALEYKFGYKI
jgi:regulatory protein